MASKVEIIIEAVDKFKKNLSNAEKGFDKLKKSIKSAGKTVGEFTKLAGAITGGFALAFNILDKFGEKAKDLGFTKAAKQVDSMKQALADSEAAILKFNLGGRQLQEWLGRAAEAFGFVIRLAGVFGAVLVGNVTKQLNNAHAGFSMLVTGIHLAAIQMRLFLGTITQQQADMQMAIAASSTYTQAMADADNALADLTIQTNVANFANVGLAKSLESVKRASTGVASSAKSQKKTVFDLIDANKKLNSTLSKQIAIDDAIRAGDARALAAARAPSGSRNLTGGTSGGSGMRANGGGAPSSRNKGDSGAPNVTVIIGGEVVKGIVRKTIHDEVLKPGGDKMKQRRK